MNSAYFWTILFTVAVTVFGFYLVRKGHRE